MSGGLTLDASECWPMGISSNDELREPPKEEPTAFLPGR
jgi:hypothetical protein